MEVVYKMQNTETLSIRIFADLIFKIKVGRTLFMNVPHKIRDISDRHPIHCDVRTKIRYSLQTPKVMSFIKNLIQEVRELYGVDIFTYSIQYNHLHFYLRICHRSDCGKAMQYILSKVALFVNRILARRGKFWEDRYFSSLKKTAAEIRRALYYILNQAKNCSPFTYPCSSVFQTPQYPYGIPKEVLNMMGAGSSEEKLRLIIEKNKAPYEAIRKVRIKKEYIQPSLMAL